MKQTDKQTDIVTTDGRIVGNTKTHKWIKSPFGGYVLVAKEKK